jgi:hypothetical protein
MMETDTQQSNLDDLTSVYRDQSDAAEADKTLNAIRTHQSQIQLSHLLRDPTKDREGTTSQEEMHQRNAFDALLEFYSIIEIASLIHYVPKRLPEDFSETAQWNLSEPMVKRYYEEIYRALLPKLFLSRLKHEISLHEKLLTDPIPVHRLFVEFLGIVSHVRDDEAIKVFLWFLDDGRRDGYGIEDTLTVLGNPEQYVERLLKPPTEWSPLDLSLRGLQGFLAFCLEFDDLWQRSNHYPLFQSSLSHYFSYWFENIGEKVARQVNRAMQAFLDWSTDKSTDKNEETVQAKEKIKAYVKDIEDIMKKLVLRVYGQKLREEADKLPAAGVVNKAENSMTVRNILLVGDDDHWRMILRTHLHDMGQINFNLRCSTYNEALELIERESPWHLLIVTGSKNLDETVQNSERELISFADHLQMPIKVVYTRETFDIRDDRIVKRARDYFLPHHVRGGEFIRSCSETLAEVNAGT